MKRKILEKKEIASSISDSDLLKITGHKNPGVFKMYITKDSLKNAKKMSKHPFFK